MRERLVIDWYRSGNQNDYDQLKIEWYVNEIRQHQLPCMVGGARRAGGRRCTYYVCPECVPVHGLYGHNIRALGLRNYIMISYKVKHDHAIIDRARGGFAWDWSCAQHALCALARLIFIDSSWRIINNKVEHQVPSIAESTTSQNSVPHFEDSFTIWFNLLQYAHHESLRCME